MNEDAVKKLDYLVEMKNTTRSEVLRKGVEIQYEELEKDIKK